MKKKSNIVSEKDLLDDFKNQDWGKLEIILIAHTIKRLRYRYGIKESNEKLKEKADLVISDVLSLIVLDNKRNWNQAEYPTFKDFVISVIDSHLYSKFKKSNPHHVDISESKEPPKSLNREDEIRYEETKDAAFETLKAAGAQDDELIVFECMADGITKPKFIKEDLGLSDKEFRNIWRRLKPRMEELRGKND